MRTLKFDTGSFAKKIDVIFCERDLTRTNLPLSDVAQFRGLYFFVWSRVSSSFILIEIRGWCRQNQLSYRIPLSTKQERRERRAGSDCGRNLSLCERTPALASVKLIHSCEITSPNLFKHNHNRPFRYGYYCHISTTATNFPLDSIASLMSYLTIFGASSLLIMFVAQMPIMSTDLYLIEEIVSHHFARCKYSVIEMIPFTKLFLYFKSKSYATLPAVRCRYGQT